MKILFLSHRVPYPPNKGDKIRSFHILKYLHERHQVHIACPVDNDDDLAALQQLQSLGYPATYEFIDASKRRLNLLKFGLSASPVSIGHFWSDRLRDRIHALAKREKFDALFVFSSATAEFAKGLDIPLRIIDFCDLDSAKFDQYASFTAPPKSWLYQLESKRLAAYEKKLLALFDHVLLISAEEQKLLHANGYASKVRTMSNGVRKDDNVAGLDVDAAHTPYILFTGVMDYLPNIDAAKWFVEQAFGKLRNFYPNLSFYIVGNNPTTTVRHLHNPRKGVYVTGFVPDVKPYLGRASVFVAPLRIARGMQTKILEAMVYGVPVVSSSASIRGIAATAGKELLAADGPDEFIQQISSILNDDKLAQKLRANAAAFVKENFDWEKNLSLLDQLLEQSDRVDVSRGV